MPATRSRAAAISPEAPKSPGPEAPDDQAPARAGSVLPEREAVEVERRAVAFFAELRPSGEVGQALVRHAATMSVRMERCVAHETAALTERVRRAIAEFVPPAGADAAEVDRLRAEAGTRAMFDASPEAAQARRYEAAASRGFFRALKELRLIEKAAKAAEEEGAGDFLDEILGSSLPMEKLDAEYAALERDLVAATTRKPGRPVVAGDLAASGGRVDVPFAIGRGR